MYTHDSVHEYKDAVVDMLAGLFPKHQLGYYFRVAYQACYGDYPEMHVHVVLSRIRYRQDDRGALKSFASHEGKSRLCRSLYFHIDPIMDSNEEMEERIEPAWRDAIEKATGRAVTSDTPLVKVTGKAGQTILDRFAALRYVANQHLHTFEHVESLQILRDGKVKMQFKPHAGVHPAPLILPARRFVLTYLIKPLRTFKIQFRGRGFLCGAAAFAPVGNAAARLVLDEPRKKGEPRTFFYDLPVTDIRERAAETRQYLEAGDMKAFKRIKAQYKPGDPLRELEILKEWRKKKRAEEFSLRKALKRQQDDKEYDDLLLTLC